MEIADARTMAERLMRQHGLDGWRLVFDNARTRAGVCRPGRRQIGLSRVLTALHAEPEVRDTVLHEIAHALVGAQHGHDRVWRAAAQRIGCSGDRCMSSASARPEAPWVGTCPAGHEVRRYRRPERVQACGSCSPRFDPRALVTWLHHGRPAVMSASYLAELQHVAALLSAQPGLPAAGAAAAARSSAPARSRAAAGAVAPLPVGLRVRLLGAGRYGGLTGEIVKRGRTRYHVQTAAGLVTAPFALVQELRSVGAGP